MEILHIRKTALIIDPIRVTMKVDPDDTTDEIRAFALAAAGETEHSHFGATVYRYDDRNAIVVIARD